MIVLMVVMVFLISNDLYFYLAFYQWYEAMVIEILVLHSGYEIFDNSFTV